MQNTKTISVQGANGTYELLPSNVLKAGGKFGLLCKAIRIENHEPVSARIVLLDSIDSRAWDRFKREIACRDLPPGFSSTLDFAISNERLFIFRKYFSGISLDKIPKDRWEFFKSKPVKEIIRFFADAALLLHQLHLQQVLHNDIRPSNLIFQGNEDDKFSWKNPSLPAFIDMGLAVPLAELPSLKQMPYALNYSPPELILEHYQLLSPASDVYALAVSLFEVLSGEKPFMNSHPELSLQMQINIPLPKDDDVPDNLYNVLKKATCKFPFPKPPNRYSKQEVEKFLKAAIDQRYPTAKEFAEALLNCI